jgi:hypothetical protein
MTLTFPTNTQAYTETPWVDENLNRWLYESLKGRWTHLATLENDTEASSNSIAVRDSAGGLFCKGLTVEADPSLEFSFINFLNSNVNNSNIANGYIYYQETNDVSGHYWLMPPLSGTVALTSNAQTFSDTQTFTGPVTSSNASVILSALPVYASNTAAASLATGSVYRTSTGELRIKY